MYKIILNILLAVLPVVSLFSQPKQEVRAAWLTTAYGLDWPANRATTLAGIKKQKDDLRKILDELQDAHFNTVLFQTRLRGDVLYPSRIEPFNEILTGKSGRNPGYDPLAFAIEECHRRGMEFHAWVVSMPLGTNKHVKTLGSASVTRKRPAICKQYQGEWFLDPGNPGTKEYLYSLVKEIITRYDVDGVHLDYIRYPDHPAGFPDQATYRKYGKGQTLATWRRNNVTSIVRHIYQGVKSLKPWVKVSSSPIGKFKDTSRYSSFGWNGFNAVYQDAQGWLREGIQDMLFPMMYFRDNQFFPFALDWQEKCYGRQIVPGLGIYFLHPSEKNWPLEVIERQIYFIRAHGLAGQAYYRAKFLTQNLKGLQDELVCKFYPYPALLPPMTWLDNVAPTAPAMKEFVENGNEVYLSWFPSIDNDTRNQPFYTVYASDVYPVDVSFPGNLVATRVRDNYYCYFSLDPGKRKKYFAVTAVDRYGNESGATQLSQPVAPLDIYYDGELLHLPHWVDAEYITVTDIAGRSVKTALYREEIALEGLQKGYYRILVTDKKERIVKRLRFSF